MLSRDPPTVAYCAQRCLSVTRVSRVFQALVLPSIWRLYIFPSRSTLINSLWFSKWLIILFYTSDAFYDNFPSLINSILRVSGKVWNRIVLIDVCFPFQISSLSLYTLMISGSRVEIEGLEVGLVDLEDVGVWGDLGNSVQGLIGSLSWPSRYQSRPFTVMAVTISSFHST